MSGEVILRALDGIEECRAAVRFQETIWGEGFSERVPASLLHVLPRVGSVAIAAWQGDRMVGFVFGVTGVERGRVVHWSDILGVAKEVRDRGIGRRLKEAQRAAAIEAGAEVMYWTFDPLEARNAWFNLHRLGVRVREYRVDMYGEPNSPLHTGIGTARLIARWSLAGTAAEAVDAASSSTGLSLDLTGPLPTPDPGIGPESGRPYRVEIPADIQAIKHADPALAARWRSAVRDVMTSAFAAGLEIRGAERVPRGLAYLLHPLPLDTDLS